MALINHRLRFVDVAIPAGVNKPPLCSRILPQGIGGGSGQRANAGVIEEIPIPQDGKCVGIANEGADHTAQDV